MSLLHDSNGYLVPGFHKFDIPTFVKTFVESDPTSNTRGEIFEGYCEYCNILIPFNFIKRQWINGSYVTKKLDPNDIDVINIVDSKAIESNESLILYIKSLEAGYETACEKYKCDAHFITEYPVDDPRREIFEKSAELWIDIKEGVYSTQNGVRKGIVELEFDPFFFETEVSCGDGISDG